MKNNLLKILVTMGVVLSLGACGKKPVQPSSQEPSSQEPSSQEPSSQETIEEVTLVELMEIDSEAEPDDTGLYPFVLEGKKVIVKGVNFAGNYQNYYVGFFTNESGSATLADMRGFFFQITDEAATKPQRYDVGDVTGTVRNWNGQVLLENASVTITNAAQWTEDGKLVPGTGSGGQWRWSLQRNYFDYLAGRALGNGAWVRGVVQLKTLPTIFSGEEDSTFQIVFPGETMKSDDNDITVRLPKNPGEDTFGRFKAFFQPEQGDAPKAGDFVLIGGLLSYNYEKEVLLDDWFGNVAKPADSELPLIENTYKGLFDNYLDEGIIFEEARMDYGTALEDAGVFSYVVDKSHMGAKLTSVYNPASDPGYYYGEEGLLHMDNPEDFTYFGYDMNFDLSEDENAKHPVEIMLEALQEAKYEIGGIQFTGGEISYSATLYEHPVEPAATSESTAPNARVLDSESTTESTSEEEDPRGAVVSQVIINLMSEDALQANIEEIGLPAPFRTDAELVAAVDEQWDKLNTSYPTYFVANSALPTDFTLGTNKVVKRSLEFDASYMNYGIVEATCILQYEEAITEENIDQLGALMVAAGFVEATLTKWYTVDVDGVFNATTNEFAAVLGVSGNLIMLRAFKVMTPAVSTYVQIADAGTSESAAYLIL